MSVFFNKKEKRQVRFCKYLIPDKNCVKHFMMVGTPGSGKTNLVRILLVDIVKYVREEPSYRAVIYDEKQEIIGFLKANGATDDSLRILNPFDSRCYEWNMARDVRGPDTALQIGTIFLPQEDSPNRYFTDAARDLFTGVLNVFIERARLRQKEIDQSPDWRLSDVLYTMRQPERLKMVLEHTEEGRDLVALHMENERTTKSVLSTARAYLAPFDVPAALWRRAGDQGRKLSLQAFLNSNELLILGNNQAARTPLQAINRVIFQRLSELALDRDETEDQPNPPRTWFVLDEVRKIGKLGGLYDLMNNGRSKGVCTILAFQDISGMREVYGDKGAEEITAMCAHHAFMKLSGPETQKWASETIGESEEPIELHNRSYQQLNVTHGVGETMHRAPLVLPSQFRSIPAASKEEGLQCYAYVPSESEDSILPCKIKAKEVDAWRGNNGEVSENRQPWPGIDSDPDMKKLPPWKPADYQRLYLNPPATTASGESGTDSERDTERTTRKKKFRVYTGGRRQEQDMR